MSRTRVPARVKRYQDELAALEAQLPGEWEDLRAQANTVKALQARRDFLVGWLAKAKEAP